MGAEQAHRAGRRRATRPGSGRRSGNSRARHAVLRALEDKQDEADVADTDLLELVDVVVRRLGGMVRSHLRDGSGGSFGSAQIDHDQRGIHALSQTGDRWTGSYGRTDIGYIWRRRARGWSGTPRRTTRFSRALYPVADRASSSRPSAHRSWSGVQVQARRNWGCYGIIRAVIVPLCIRTSRVTTT